jgi:hypothetical protein
MNILFNLDRIDRDFLFDIIVSEVSSTVGYFRVGPLPIRHGHRYNSKRRERS